MGLRVSFRTFGCKLNQAETESIADSFSRACAVVAGQGEAADLFIFNTCTVTSKAEQKARREIRLAIRLYPDAVALVTGCYAELDAEAVSTLAPRTIVIPGSRKDGLKALAAGLVAAKLEGLDLYSEARRLVDLAAGRVPDPFDYVPGDARWHSRVQLKVQDGCDNRCTYCRVCLARGRSVSLAPGEALVRAAALEARGVAEIVLTGVNLSQYRSGGLYFPGLLESIINGTQEMAFRVSSYEPDRVDESFVRAFGLRRVRPHLHLSIQSGSDRILAAMGRHYDRALVLRAVDSVRAVRDDPFIGADIILGFPGETDADFQDTVDLLEHIQPAWVHAFTFSPRPGTRAFELKPRVPERIAAERAALVQALAVRGKAAFASRRAGAVLEAVAETRDHDAHDSIDTGVGTYATSSEYLKVLVHGVPPGFKGSCTCRATGVTSQGIGDELPDLVAEFMSAL